MSEEYKSYIRSLACLVDGRWEKDCDRCWGPVAPHHRKARGIGGNDKGKTDDSCVPVCTKHHSELEQIGETKFQVKHEIDLKFEMSALQKQWKLYQRR